MFLHLSVILSTGGGVSSRHPQADASLGQTPPCVTPPKQTPPRQTPPPARQTPPPARQTETATAANGTHPTGMHFLLLLGYTSHCDIHIMLVFGTRLLHMHFYQMYILPIYPFYI